MVSRPSAHDAAAARSPATSGSAARRAAILRSALVDAGTAEVARALQDRGIRPILLKGPVIARWLYAEEPSARPYVDCDLLVAPEHAEATAARLAELGFDALERPVLAADGHHARVFIRERDHMNIDLHHTFHGMESVPRRRLWDTLAGHLSAVEIGGVWIDAPDETLLTLLVALHLRAIDEPGSKPWVDLERALARVAPDRWQEAGSLAQALGIERELAARLRRVPAGARRADDLGLPRERSLRYDLLGAVARERAPQSVLTLQHMREQPTRRAALGYAARKLVPPGEQLHRDYPRLAASGTGGFTLARVLRAARMLRRLPGALRAYRATARRGGA